MSVRETLARMFPEVDRRIIAATAREHKDDLEGAIGYIEYEVLNPAEDVPPPSEEKPRDEVLQPLEINTEAFEESLEMAIEKKEQLKNAMVEVQRLRIEASEAEDEVKRFKMEASVTAEDYLFKAQKLKELVLRGKHQNELREAEIFGEKAVLKTEAREADSRLEQVRKEWENAMNLADQCKSSLERRIKSAKVAALTARDEVLNNEVRASQELVSQESQLVETEARAKQLDSVADECTRVREFLIQKGTVIDSLQGEIAVLVEDVLLLKTKIDGVAAGIYQDSFYAEQEELEEPVVVAANEDDRDWQEIENDVMKTINGELDSELDLEFKDTSFVSSKANGSVVLEDDTSSRGSFDLIENEEWFSAPFTPARSPDGRTAFAAI